MTGKSHLLILGMCICIYSQGNSALYKINSKGGKPSIGTLPDTTYYQSESFSEKEKIYSITEYNQDKTVKQYANYFVNGDKNYYCLYEYINGQCTKEKYYDVKNQQTGYAEYTNNSFGGKNYTFFNKDAVQLYEIQYDSALSALDSSWQCRVYTVRTVNNAQYSKKLCQYSTGGWLEKEIYLNYKNDTVATGSWGYDPLSSITAYTYSLKNGKYMSNVLPDVLYDQYKNYYKESKSADSCRLYKQNTLLYTIKYIYDTKGWLKEERYFNSANILVYRGEYTFDKAASTTSFRFLKEPALLLSTYTTDYRGLGIEFKQYTTDGKLQSSIRYGYNEGLYWDTVSAYDSTGVLLSFETYSYFTPYYMVKSYTTFDAKKNMLSNYNYDEFGNIKDSIVVKTVKSGSITSKVFNNGVFVENNSIIIKANENATLNLKLFDISGKMICEVTRELSEIRTVLPLNHVLSTRAYGTYLYKVNIGCDSYSGVFHYNR